MTLVSAAVLLFLVTDPVGNAPVFASLLSHLPPGRRRAVIVRELLFALAVMVTFLFVGEALLDLLQVSEPALSISGGVILFLIALRMIFLDPSEIFGRAPEGEPFFVPLAVPLIAGPSALATILLLRARQPDRWPEWLAAILLAWFVGAVVLLAADPVTTSLGRRGATAVQRLMGMLLTTVSVQMFLSGVRKFLAET
ncbi:MAG TPA: MarC family protein [Planctomycetaceae bacterium]